MDMRFSSISWADCDNIIGVGDGTNLIRVPRCCRSGNSD